MQAFARSCQSAQRGQLWGLLSAAAAGAAAGPDALLLSRLAACAEAQSKAICSSLHAAAAAASARSISYGSPAAAAAAQRVPEGSSSHEAMVAAKKTKKKRTPRSEAAAAAASDAESAAEPAAARQPVKRRKRGAHMEWTSELEGELLRFWRDTGITGERRLQRLIKWGQRSHWCRDIGVLRQMVASFAKAAEEAGRPPDDGMALLFSNASVMMKGRDPKLLFRNLNALEEIFQRYNLKSDHLRRSRLLLNKPESVAARIEPFLEVVRSWPIKVDPIMLLSCSPELLVSHSNMASYGDRIKLLAEWLPPGLDLTQVITKMPMILNFPPDGLTQKWRFVKEVIGVNDEDMAKLINFAPSLLLRRPEALQWKMEQHAKFAELRKQAGYGDELEQWRSAEGQWPSRLCNLLVNSVERMQRLGFLTAQVQQLEQQQKQKETILAPDTEEGAEGQIEEQDEEQEKDPIAVILKRSGYTWVRATPHQFNRVFPEFVLWLQERPANSMLMGF